MFIKMEEKYVAMLKNKISKPNLIEKKLNFLSHII